MARRFPQGKGTLVKFAVRNQKGKAVVDLKGVPLEQMLLLAEALFSRSCSPRPRRPDAALLNPGPAFLS